MPSSICICITYCTFLELGLDMQVVNRSYGLVVTREHSNYIRHFVERSGQDRCTVQICLPGYETATLEGRTINGLFLHILMCKDPTFFICPPGKFSLYDFRGVCLSQAYAPYLQIFSNHCWLWQTRTSFTKFQFMVQKCSFGEQPNPDPAPFSPTRRTVRTWVKEYFTNLQKVLVERAV